MDRARRMPGIVGLATSAFTQTADLVQAEIRLARAEVNEKVSAAVASVAMLLAGAIFLIAALFLVFHGIAAFLISKGWSAEWAYAVVAVGAGVIGVILLSIGKGRLANVELTPRRTLHQFEQDAHMAREKVS